MFKLTKHNIEKEEHTELMVELLHIKLCLVTFKYLLHNKIRKYHQVQKNNKNLAENN